MIFFRRWHPGAGNISRWGETTSGPTATPRPTFKPPR